MSVCTHRELTMFCFAGMSTLAYSLCHVPCLCVCCGNSLHTPAALWLWEPSNSITNSLRRSPLWPSETSHKSLIIAMPMESSLPRALPHLPDLLGNPEGDLELNSQPLFSIRINMEIWAAAPMCLNPSVALLAYWWVYVCWEAVGRNASKRQTPQAVPG